MHNLGWGRCGFFGQNRENYPGAVMKRMPKQGNSEKPAAISMLWNVSRDMSNRQYMQQKTRIETEDVKGAVIRLLV